MQCCMLVCLLLVLDPTLTMQFFSSICHMKPYLAYPHSHCYMIPPTMDSETYGRPMSKQLKNTSTWFNMVSTWRIFTTELPYLSPIANALANAHQMMKESLTTLMMLSLRLCYVRRLNAKKQKAMHGHPFLPMQDAPLLQPNGIYQLS